MTTATTNNRISNLPKTTKKVARKAAARDTVKGIQEIKIPSLKTARAVIRIEGVTPLIVHAWSEKAKRMMLDKQMKKNVEKEPKSPVEDFLSSMYWLEGDIPDPTIDDSTKIKTYDEKKVKNALEKAVFGLPAVCIKKSIVTAARYVSDLKMTQTRGCVFVSGHEQKRVSWSVIDFVRICSPHVPFMREDMVRVGNGTADIRYRGEFRDWHMDIVLETNANAMSIEQVVSLLNIAGFHGGLGERRPEKTGDTFGRFRIVQV